MYSIWKRPFILQKQSHWNQWSHWYVYCIAYWHKINIIWGFWISCWMSLLVQLLDNLLRFPLGLFQSGCIACFKWFGYRALHTIGATVWLQHTLLWLCVACWTTRANLSLAFPHKRLSLWLLKQWTTTRSLRSGRLWKQVSIFPKWRFLHVSRSSIGLPPDCPQGLNALAWTLMWSGLILCRQEWQLNIHIHFLHNICFK